MPSKIPVSDQEWASLRGGADEAPPPPPSTAETTAMGSITDDGEGDGGRPAKMAKIDAFINGRATASNCAGAAPPPPSSIATAGTARGAIESGNDCGEGDDGGHAEKMAKIDAFIHGRISAALNGAGERTAIDDLCRTDSEKISKIDAFIDGRAASAAGNGETKKRKGAAASKDPNKPKRPVPANLFFRSEQAPVLKAAGMDSSVQAIGERWRALPETDRRRYKELEDQDKIRYAREMASYVPPPPSAAPVADGTVADGTGKKKRHRAKKHPDAPKHITSAYLFFMSEVAPSLKAAGMDSSGTAMGERWRALPDADRRRYKELEDEDKRRYAREMADYIARGGRWRANAVITPPPPSDASAAAASGAAASGAAWI